MFAAQFALSHSTWLVAYPLAGTLGAAAGLPITFLVMALISGIASLIAFRLWPSFDPMEIEHDHAALDHVHSNGDPEHHQGEVVQSKQPLHHHHAAIRHSHPFVIDDHHPVWPKTK